MKSFVFFGRILLLFLFLISPFFVYSAQTTYYVQLADQTGEEFLIELNHTQAQFFPTVLASHLHKKSVISKWEYENVPYETFDFLLPLCDSLGTVGDFRTMIPEPEIVSAKQVLPDTKKVIEWLYKQKRGKDSDDFDRYIIETYRSINYLLMPFAIRRGLVNYLYDQGKASLIIEPFDLKYNLSGLLISNKEIPLVSNGTQTQSRRMRISGINNKNPIEKTPGLCDFYLNFSNQGIRFFDFLGLCCQLKKIHMVTFLFEQGFAGNTFYIDLSENNIREIGFNLCNTFLFDNYHIKGTVFDLRNNPLSNECKEYIKKPYHAIDANVKQYGVTYEVMLKKFEKAITRMIANIIVIGLALAFLYSSFCIVKWIWIFSVNNIISWALLSLFKGLFFYYVSLKSIILGFSILKTGIKFLPKNRVEFSKCRLARDMVLAERKSFTPVLGGDFYLRYDQ